MSGESIKYFRKDALRTDPKDNDEEGDPRKYMYGLVPGCNRPKECTEQGKAVGVFQTKGGPESRFLGFSILPQSRIEANPNSRVDQLRRDVQRLTGEEVE